MANREELLIIRAARGGVAVAQLALGKRYLFGGGGLPQSMATALHWLERAAEQNQQDAWRLIGSHIPFEAARRSTDPMRVALWYERAFEEGIAKAGLVLAMLVFAEGEQVDGALRKKALYALQSAAQAGLPEAQWLFAQKLGFRELNPRSAEKLQAQALAQRDSALEWAARAAKGGVIEAQYLLANYAWDCFDFLKYLFWALPLAQQIERRGSGPASRRRSFTSHDLEILSRCVRAMIFTSDSNGRLIERYLKLMADSGELNAQITLGLWIARIDHEGERVNGMVGVAHYKKALRWLGIAAERGADVAWFAMSRIYLKPEFSRRSVPEARRSLEIAAVAGNVRAQMELGLTAWRGRRVDPRSDIQAIYWLQKASGQGHKGARSMLQKISQPSRRSEWARLAREFFTREMTNQYPFLAARIELGYWFGLTRAEALLLDVETADHGHCLEVDIRKEHLRSRRRLIPIQTGEQRNALDRAVRTFETFDIDPSVPEGNYRKRLYRYRSLMRTRRKQARLAA
jgi:TPR repeat protein